MQYLPYVLALLLLLAVSGMCVLVAVMRASHRQYKAASAKVDCAIAKGGRATEHRIDL